MSKRVAVMNVNGTRYDVMEVSATEMVHDEGETVYGYCDIEKTTILLLDTLSIQASRNALRHEAGHASCEESGARNIIQQFTKTATKADELEEFLVRVWLPVYLSSLNNIIADAAEGNSNEPIKQTLQ